MKFYPFTKNFCIVQIGEVLYRIANEEMTEIDMDMCNYISTPTEEFKKCYPELFKIVIDSIWPHI